MTNWFKNIAFAISALLGIGVLFIVIPRVFSFIPAQYFWWIVFFVGAIIFFFIYSIYRRVRG